MTLAAKSLADLCQRVGTSLEAGVDIRRIWASEANRGTRASRRAAAAVGQQVNRGESTTEAMAATGAFPPMVCQMVEIGEETGRLDETFLRLSENYQRQISLRRMFMAGILWPMIQLTAAVLIIGLLIWVMGLIGQMTGETVDILGLGLVGTRGVAIYFSIVAVIVLLLVVCYRYIIGGRWAGGSLGRVILRLPVLGNCLRTLALARLAWTLGVTLDTGMDTAAALSLSIRSTQNAFYTSQIPAATRSIRNGNEIAATLRNLGGYPVEFLDAVDVGEQTGKLSQSLALLARQYEDRAKAALNTLTVVAGFAVWGLVAAVIIALIFRLAMFYIGTINEFANGL